MSTEDGSSYLYIPDNVSEEAACSRVTHLGIGAHQDDLEFMAFHGIKECYSSDSEWFGGLVCTNGDGYPRSGASKFSTVEDIRLVRWREQIRAARIGRYSFVRQLNHASDHVKDPESTVLQEGLLRLLTRMRPRVIYTHNPTDRHPTHVAVMINVLRALRRLAPEHRPLKLYGCEVWRSLDWLSEPDKICLDVSGYDALATALVDVFESQISGGKRYDRAILGRRYSNATFHAAHETDTCSQLWYALDLTTLMASEEESLDRFVSSCCSRFTADLRSQLEPWESDSSSQLKGD